ncbi:thiopeptide-type bacteriocin biosynthesis protein [Mucilaginibacter sp. CAU 1740]|uniref:lantibiotic dehydratase n=1 Tax=Mucilaginibacter sp. CAU 1740 TaxID=3140365 RepID=UPI00325AF0C5
MADTGHIVFLDKVFVRRPYYESSAYEVGKLRDVLKSNVFKNAIWLASAAFFEVLEKKGFAYDLLSAKERLTALKFYNRMSFRGTPFGAFAAFGLADWGADRGKGKKEGYTLHLLPSVEKELGVLRASPLTGKVLIAVNPTLYRLSSGWRYYRYEEDSKGKLSFPVYLLRYDPADELILAYLDEKPLALAELVSYLVEITDCTREEGAEHIARLIDEQVLVSEHALSLLVDRVMIGQRKVVFDEGLRLFDAAARKDLGLAQDDVGRAFYAGTEMQGAAGLPAAWQRDILEALNILDLLAPVAPKNNVDKFREAFEQKFGERSVPLLEALDPDLGVAFDNEQQPDEHDLLKGVVFKGSVAKNEQLNWTPVHRLLTKLWLQNTKRGQWEPVVITASDCAELPGNTLPFPPSTSVFCSLQGGKLVFQNIGGATANALTGRFSVFSDDFEVFCRETARQECEANPGVLFAEIEQVSHRGIDNINRRKQVYEHVVPLNAFPGEGGILPKDMDVLVRGEEVLLVHRPSGKRIIPRLPTAFNYHHNEMPLFRFLCALQFKGIRANFDFDPEKVFPGLNFYPRIEYGRCVISLARWYVDEAEVAALVCRPLSISRLHLFCRERGIASVISMGRGDQQLFFDLGKDEEALFFLEAIGDQGRVVLTESLVRSVDGWDRADPFNSQFVVSLRNPQAVFQGLQVIPSSRSAVREFHPGSEWIYLKIYATFQSMEQLLLQVVLPWIGEHQDRIRRWFFVRYDDTGSHLRLRLLVDPSAVKDLQFELQSLLNPIGLSGLVQRFYFDTYVRELERYHGELIEEVEEVFYRGSEVIAAKLTGGEMKDDGDLTWPVVHCYRIVSAFLGSGYDKINRLCAWAAGAFFKEHGGSKDLKRSMDERYREIRPALLRSIESGPGYGDDPLIIAIKQLDEKAGSLKDGERMKLIADIVHMQVNRIFVNEQRRYETFIWHCLSKLVVTMAKKQASVEVSVMDGP